MIRWRYAFIALSFIALITAFWYASRYIDFVLFPTQTADVAKDVVTPLVAIERALTGIDVDTDWPGMRIVVAGLLPMAYGLGGSDPFSAPMALAMGYGILFATPITLLLIPCLLMVMDDAHGLIDRLMNNTRAA